MTGAASSLRTGWGERPVKAEPSAAATFSLADSYPDLDPVAFEVIGSGLESVTREMGITTVRTATSPTLVDTLDFSCAILDRYGKLVAAANYDPSHLAGMANAVEAALLEFGQSIDPGDVILQNNPYLGGTHLPDFTVVTPIFFDDELIAFAANRAHHVDAGGKSGGFSADAKNIYAEGLRLPVVKWYAAGVENTDLFRTVLLNIRLSDLQEVDFRAQLASCRTAEKRVVEICRRYGSHTVSEAMSARLDYSEALMRSVIERIPDGTYEGEDYMDDDACDSRPMRIHVTVTVSGSDVLVDFAGTSAQALSASNMAYGMTWAATYIAFLQLAPPDLPFSGGCFRCIRIVAPRHTLVTPQPPAAVFAGTIDTCLRTIDAIGVALAGALPDDFVAATYGSAFCFAGDGHDARRKTECAFHFAYEGGWGASSSRDGWDCTPNQTSNYKDFPVEVMEQKYPLRCDEVRLRCDSGGAGRFRGGLGVRRAFTVVDAQLSVSCLADRFRFRPYGLFGGLPGAANALRVVRGQSAQERTFQEEWSTLSPSKVTDIPLTSGDKYIILTGGGGGYGDPVERDPTLVLEDVLDGAVSMHEARRTYGVVIADAAVDQAATKRERGQLRTARKSKTPGGLLNTAINRDPALVDAVAVSESVVPPPIDDVSGRIDEAQKRIDASTCRSECPRRADAGQCPWWCESSVNFFSIETFVLWTRSHCCQERTLRDALGV